MNFKIKLSKIIEVLRDGEEEYICLAIRKEFRKSRKVKKQGYIDTTSVHRALHTLMPLVFKPRVPAHTTIFSWMNSNKLPNNLRSSALLSMDNDEYRIRFLQWMISKVGDQTITVEVY